MRRSIEGMKIAEILRGRVPLLPGTLSPVRLKLVDDFYDHVRKLCGELASVVKGAPAAIALGVPEIYPNGRVMMRFPVYEALGDFKNDARAQSFRERAIENKLEFDASECLVGLSLGFLTKNDWEEIDQFREHLAEDAERPANCDDTWLELENPEVRYKSCFQRAWERDNPAGWHYIRPIVFDRAGIFAGFAVDFVERAESSPFSLIRETIERLLLGIYKSYYCHFGASKNGRELPWSARGRVLDRRYLEGLTEALDADGLDECFPDAESCLVLFCDGDGIKRINDQYSHDLGNEVIQMLASTLCDTSDSLRLDGDKINGIIDAIVIRWAGDEFVVVIPLKRDVNHLAVIEKFKSKAEDYLSNACKMIRAVKRKNIKVDLSIGWAVWRKKSQMRSSSFRSAWFEMAEHAMYVAKDGAKLLESLSKKEANHKRHAQKRGRSRISIGEYTRVMAITKTLATELGLQRPKVRLK